MKSGGLAPLLSASRLPKTIYDQERVPPHPSARLGGLALPATTPRPPPFGHLEALGPFKSNSAKHLHPRSLLATGFLLARSEMIWPFGV